MDSHFERIFYERRPVSGNGAHVVLFTLLFVALSGGGLYGLFSALETGNSRWFALTFACVIGVFVLGWRVRQHDERAFVEQERATVRPQPETEVKPIRVYTHVSNGGGKVTVGRFSFTPGQWHALKSAISKGKGKLLRDPVRQARPHIFDAADIADWPSIVEEFQRLGLIDDRQELTDTGRKFFRSDPFTVPMDPPTPGAASFANGRYGGGGEGGEEEIA
jgi:hypothetical protein